MAFDATRRGSDDAKRGRLKADLEIIKGNVGAALESLALGHPAKLPETENLDRFIADVKIRTFQIAGILEQLRHCERGDPRTLKPCLRRGRWRRDQRAVLCDKHYDAGKMLFQSKGRPK